MRTKYTGTVGMVVGMMLFALGGIAQTVPLNLPELTDYYRRRQLLGALDSTISFNVQPLGDVEYADGKDDGNSPAMSATGYRSPAGFIVKPLPVTMRHQLVSAYPYGWNDGATIPARGYQMYASAGIFAQYKFISVQLNPEFVYAQNRRYEGYGGAAGPDRNWYSRIGNRFDAPELFGNGSYSKVYPGQSSVRLTYKGASLGFSTENIWWGPGRRNAIIMSNNAPGFRHVTLNTTKPINTIIGSFEGQIVGGRLEASGYPASLLGDTSVHSAYQRERRGDWRYFSGMVLSYQPKWIPGFSLGFARAFTIYRDDMNDSFGAYFPIFGGVSKNSVTNNDGSENLPSDQVISLFFRWVLPAAHFELYGEYGRNDHAWDGRDGVVQLDHTRAYIFGLRKLVPLNETQETYLQIAAEITQMGVTNTNRIRSAGPWYMHGHHGYTHRGQVLGAGIGPGSNLQSLDLGWVKGMKQAGLRVERFTHDEDFANLWINRPDYRRNWVDLSFEGYAVWDYQRWLGSLAVQYIHAYNYQYGFDFQNTIGYWGFTPQDKSNFLMKLGVMYRF